MMPNVIEGIVILIVAPVFVYVVFRAAASGWFGVKHAYQRRFMDIVRHDGDEARYPEK